MSTPDRSMKLAARKPVLPSRKPGDAVEGSTPRGESSALPSRKPNVAGNSSLPSRRPKSDSLPSRKPGGDLPARVRRERVARRGFSAPISGKVLLASRIVGAHKEFTARSAAEDTLWEEYVFQGDWTGWNALPKRLKELSLLIIMDGSELNMVFPGVGLVDTADGLSLSVSGVALSSGDVISPEGVRVPSGSGEFTTRGIRVPSKPVVVEEDDENEEPSSVDEDLDSTDDASTESQDEFWGSDDVNSGSGSEGHSRTVDADDSQDDPQWEDVEYGEEAPVEVDDFDGEDEPKKAPVSRGKSLKNLEDSGFASVSEVNWADAEEEAQEDKRQAILGYVSDAQIRLMDRDIDIIDFLTRYKFALDTQVARRVNTSRKAAWIRLSKLEKGKLVRRVDITRGQTVWLATQRGVDLVLPGWKATRAENVSLVTMAHELGLANIGIELEIGGEDVLKQGEGWPAYNREDRHGEMVLGERVVTTREIRVGEARWDKDTPREEKKAYVQESVSSWSGSGFTAETLPGNEGFFVMYSDDYRDHVPDMVAARERDAEDGSPNSVAIELELSPKTVGEWERILLNYKGSPLFKRVVYFTHKQSIALGLKRVNDERVGLTEEEFTILRYEPKKKNSPFWG